MLGLGVFCPYIYHVPVGWITQAYAQYLNIGARMIFGIMQQYDFYCVLVMGSWENLYIFRLTDNP